MMAGETAEKAGEVVPLAEADQVVRVVLVGRTGLDAGLRLDRELEIVRVPTALEAIGEAAGVTEPGMPSRVVVVVGPNTVQELEEQGASRLSEFVSAVREARPGAVVLGVGRSLSVPPLDAVLAEGTSPDEARKMMRWTPRNGRNGPAPTPEVTPTIEPVPKAEPEAPVVRAPSREPGNGDLTLVGLLLRGQDVGGAGVAMLRERLSDPTIDFVPGAPDSSGVPVMWEGARFGVLRARRTEPIALAAGARWLAGWLRLQDQQSQLRQAAFTDPLTGAWNRRYFDRFLATAIEHARGARHPVTVLLFDIDNFKLYNDRYGHDAGDEILTECVKLMRSVVRPTDRVCRVGGDEFVVVFHEPEGPRQEGSRHPSSVYQIARRFQQQVNQHKFPKLMDCARGTLTISGGLATFPWDGSSPEELLRRADELALESKRQGKNALTLGPGAMRLADL